MNYEGYDVAWSDSRKYITYTCPNGRKCRDNKLHDDTYLKENMEKIFAYRQAVGFVPLTPEPKEGWLTQAETFFFGDGTAGVSCGTELFAAGKWQNHCQK